MGNPSAAHEPSMEEILASIRQIISEDSDSAPAKASALKSNRAQETSAPIARAPESGAPGPDDFDAGAGPESHEPEAAAELARPASQWTTAPMNSQAVAPKPAQLREAQSEEIQPMAKSSLREAAAPRPAMETIIDRPVEAETAQSAAPRRDGERGLLSSNADAAVSGAFSALAHTILAQNARTLEELVSEMLRPMLKEWLEDNLPPLVERLVKEEIDRVSRGRR